MTVRLGSDPEVLLVDSNGVFRSSVGYIGAGKTNPKQVPRAPKGFTLQEDNVTLEFGIPPASSREQFVDSIKRVMEYSKPYIKGLTFSKLSCTIYPEEEMKTPQANMFGCEPDYNAWTEKMNASPRPPHPFLRSAGGHIHIETTRNPLEVVRLMDLFLGVPSILMDTGEERKQLYGAAGAHRVKSYGVEYRTLSNFWIFEDRLVQWAWDNTQRAVESSFDVMVEQERILKAINTNDKDVAKQLVNEYELEVV